MPLALSPCPVCTGERQRLFTDTVLGRHQASYCHCPACGFLQIEDPHWLAEAYGEAIARTDTGLVARNLAAARVMTVLWSLRFGARGTLVDVAGGYGLFVRLMRDAGIDARWEDRYARNLLAPGFEAVPGTAAMAVTAFEVLEHVTDPLAFLADALKRWNCQRIFFTTETYAGPPPTPGTWAYYAPETGQHIGFFQQRTLEMLAQRLGLVCRRLGHVHAFVPAGDLPGHLPWCCGRASHLLAPWLRRQRSLTMDDHRLAVNTLRHGRDE